MGGMAPEGKVYTLARQESLNGLHTIKFLLHLLRVAGERPPVIWDGSPVHRREAVREFLAGTGGAIRVEALPSYAPDLNPWDEGGGGTTSSMSRCATRSATTLKSCMSSSTSPSVASGRSGIWSNPFFAQAGLSLEKTQPPLRSDH